MEQFNLVHLLVDYGLNDCQIARATGIPRATIRDWRRNQSRGCGASGRYSGRARANDCPVCGNRTLDPEAYAYLLGLYLGDGCITPMPKGVFKLRVVLDLKYPSIIDECAAAMIAVRPDSGMAIGRILRIGCLELTAHWKHWVCLFPQHGPGPKHARPIELADWQQRIASTHPDRLLRGLIHSDGYRGLNWVNGTGYPRYQFSNKSCDIRAIFCRACDDYGVAWRRMNSRTISVARRADVAKLDSVIGPKSRPTRPL